MAKLLGCILLACLAWGFLSKQQMEESAPEKSRQIASLAQSNESAWLTYRMKLYEQVGLTDAEIKRLIELDNAFTKARDEIVAKGAQDASDAKKKKEWDLVLQRLEQEHINQQIGVVGRKRFQVLMRSLTEFRQVYLDLTGEAAPQNTW